MDDRIIVRMGAFLWALLFVAAWFGKEWALVIVWAVLS